MKKNIELRRERVVCVSNLEVKLRLDQKSGRGQMELKHGPTIPIAGTTDDYGIAPYQMLLGALGYCLSLTLRDILVKQKVDFGEIEVLVDGEKKKEQIAHLTKANVDLFITTAQKNQEKVGKAMELAKKYCSIYYTLQQIAQIEVSYQIK